jgi:hypothetical protein
MRFLLHTTPLLLVAATLTAPARADIITSNFSAPVGVGTAFGSGSTTQFKAVGFTMGNAAYVLDDAILTMTFNVASPLPVISIWSDSNGPGTQLLVLDNPAMLSGQADYTFTAGTPLVLAANTTYWLHVMSNPPTMGPAFLWEGTTPSTVPSGIATAVGYNFNGATSATRNRLEINGSPAGGGLGTTYCTPGVSNSTGSPATIEATGSLTVASNDVTLTAESLPNNAFGFFLTSRTQGLVPNAGGSAGNLCLGGSIGRYVGPGQIQNSGTVGSFDLALDLPMTPTPTGLVAIVAGETWNFQAWHRDSVGGAATSNFTDAVSLTFQ